MPPVSKSLTTDSRLLKGKVLRLGALKDTRGVMSDLAPGLAELAAESRAALKPPTPHLPFTAVAKASVIF